MENDRVDEHCSVCHVRAGGGAGRNRDWALGTIGVHARLSASTLVCCFAPRPVAGSCRGPAAGGSPSLLSLLVATTVRLRGSRLSSPRQAARPIACRCWWRRRRGVRWLRGENDRARETRERERRCGRAGDLGFLFSSAALGPTKIVVVFSSATVGPTKMIDVFSSARHRPT